MHASVKQNVEYAGGMMQPRPIESHDAAMDGLAGTAQPHPAAVQDVNAAVEM